MSNCENLVQWYLRKPCITRILCVWVAILAGVIFIIYGGGVWRHQTLICQKLMYMICQIYMKYVWIFCPKFKERNWSMTMSTWLNLFGLYPCNFTSNFWYLNLSTVNSQWNNETVSTWNHGAKMKSTRPGNTQPFGLVVIFVIFLSWLQYILYLNKADIQPWRKAN